MIIRQTTLVRNSGIDPFYPPLGTTFSRETPKIGVSTYNGMMIFFTHPIYTICQSQGVNVPQLPFRTRGKFQFGGATQRCQVCDRSSSSMMPDSGQRQLSEKTAAPNSLREEILSANNTVKLSNSAFFADYSPYYQQSFPLHTL